jgi:hypothetical protein
MDDATYDFFSKVVKLSHVSWSGVMSVVLAMNIVRRDLSPPADPGTDPPKVG